jgi:predicted N-acetyltransferase YhbS
MADGPRALLPEEWPQLDALVSTVFRSTMLANYPQLFNAENRDNLRVVADEGRVVSHVGMIQRSASLLGCGVKVACVGAVATYPEQRGHGYASLAFQDCCELAAADGCDLILISGGRGLYTRVGCRRVGQDWTALVDVADAATAARLPATEALEVRAIGEERLDAVAALYQAEPVRFLRPLEDWQRAFACRIVMAGHAEFWGLFLHDRLVAYIVVQPPRAGRQATDTASVRVVEYAGDRAAIVGALSRLAHHYQARQVNLHLQGWDRALRLRLLSAGSQATPSPTWGTLRVLNFPQFMERCRPMLAERLGTAAAAGLRFAADEQPGSAVGGFTISAGSRQLRLPDLGTLATFLFTDAQGPAPESPEAAGLRALLQPALPLPTLWYGISYV